MVYIIQSQYISIRHISTDNYKSLPMVEKITNECISLPIYPEISKKDVTKICNILNEYE